MARIRTGRLSAFTLIELLVVIGIIAVLAGIGLAVGNGVIESSRAATTQNTIQLLEGYLSDLDDAGVDKSQYRSFKTEYAGEDFELPVLDGRESGDGVTKEDLPIDSLARFLAAGDQFLGDSGGRWGGLDSSTIRDVVIAETSMDPLRGITLTDQWDRPIRAVHPSFDGGFGVFHDKTGAPVARDNLSVTQVHPTQSSNINFRRSFRPFDHTGVEDFVGDADEGICQNERVYFYSAGPDGDPGTREDNVYSMTSTPRYPAETRDLD
ncbi:MAG: type II secretion system protein [Phycisphaerales bacterium JB061]